MNDLVIFVIIHRLHCKVFDINKNTSPNNTDILEYSSLKNTHFHYTKCKEMKDHFETASANVLLISSLSLWNHSAISTKFWHYGQKLNLY